MKLSLALVVVLSLAACAQPTSLMHEPNTSIVEPGSKLDYRARCNARPTPKDPANIDCRFDFIASDAMRSPEASTDEPLHRSITCGDGHSACTMVIENKPQPATKPQIVRCVQRHEGLAFTWPTPPTLIDCELNGVKFEIVIEGASAR